MNLAKIAFKLTKSVSQGSYKNKTSRWKNKVVCMKRKDLKVIDLSVVEKFILVSNAIMSQKLINIKKGIWYVGYAVWNKKIKIV